MANAGPRGTGGQVSKSRPPLVSGSDAERVVKTSTLPLPSIVKAGVTEAKGPIVIPDVSPLETLSSLPVAPVTQTPSEEQPREENTYGRPVIRGTEAEAKLARRDSGKPGIKRSE